MALRIHRGDPEDVHSKMQCLPFSEDSFSFLALATYHRSRAALWHLSQNGYEYVDSQLISDHLQLGSDTDASALLQAKMDSARRRNDQADLLLGVAHAAHEVQQQRM